MNLKKESSQKRYNIIRWEYARLTKQGWKKGRVIDALAQKYHLSFRTIVKYCGYQ